MEMRLKGAIVALLTVLGAALELTREIRLNLKKTNDAEKGENTVSPGSSLKLHCCLSENTFERCRVSWHFSPFGENQTEPDENSTNICNWTETTTCNLTNVCHNAKCPLSIVNESNSGWYFCKVTREIPTLETLESNKIKVIVTSQKEERDLSENLWMWIVVGVSSFVLVVVALLVICVVQKRECSRSIEEPVYVNTRLGKPSPRLMPADNPKSASSSQDLRTPISARRYEGRNQRYKH